MKIALLGSMTTGEKALVQSPAGADQVRKFHSRLFANSFNSLRQVINRITGMEIYEMTAEIDPTTDSVVHVFTTDTIGEKFLLARDEPDGGGMPGTDDPSRP